MIHKLIVHDGIFHADDAMATALVLEFVRDSVPVERTRNISADEFDNPNIWIVDVGEIYDPSKRCFDHHQDNTLDAACKLVLEHLWHKGLISEQIVAELISAISEISLIDCQGPKPDSGFQFNSLIKSFNALENGWDLAVETCRNYIKACVSTANQTVQSREIWDAGVLESMYIRVCNAFPIHWKRYEEEPLLVYPNKGKWNLLSVNSEIFPIISNGKESFIHANKFLAVFDSKKDAVDAAQRTALNTLG